MSDLPQPTSTRSPAVFTLFRELPPELRIKIWSYTFPKPSVIQIYSEAIFSEVGAGAHLIGIVCTTCSDGHHPVALSICQESREFTRATYKPLFLSSPRHKAKIPYKSQGVRRTYIDFEHDTLLYGPQIDMQDLGAWMDLSKITNMALNVQIYFQDAEMIGQPGELWDRLSDELTGLKSLKLVLDSRPPQAVPFGMHKTACQLVDIDSNFADLVESLQQRNSRLERAGLRSLHPLQNMVSATNTLKSWFGNFTEKDGRGRKWRDVELSVAFTAKEIKTWPPKRDGTDGWYAVFHVSVPDVTFWAQEFDPRNIMNGILCASVSRRICGENGEMDSRYDGLGRLFQVES